MISPSSVEPAVPVPAKQRHPLLAREGWWHILISLSLALLVQHYAGTLWALPLWVFVLFVIQFFRDPMRPIPAAADAIICPADGRVIAVGQVDDPYLKRPALRLSVFMNVFNVHSNRSPLEGEIRQRWYHPGKFVNAALDKASDSNERNALWIRDNQGRDIVVVQVAGLVARRILCYVNPGERIDRGQRYGFIRFGSRVDIYLPLNSLLKVGLGDKVTAGSEILAFLPN